MAKRKIILGIDYNNLAYRSIYTCRYGNDIVVSYDTDDECAIFAKSLIRDIIGLIKMFGANEAYLLADSKDPWRKGIYPDYKATRKHDDDINFANIYKTMDEVYDVLKEYGVYRLLIDNAEADDLAAMLKSIFKKEQSNMILVSSDADWQQLVEFNKETKQFISVYTPIIVNRRGYRPLYVGEGFEEWLEEGGIMSGENSSAKFSIMQAMQTERTLKIIPINPQDIILKKVMCGDDSDNVPSFYDFLNKSGKTVRVTELRKNKVFECCGCPTNIDELQGRAEDGSLERSFKEALKWDVSEVDMSERLQRQRVFVQLEPTLFPKVIRESFVNDIKTIDRTKLEINSRSLNVFNIIRDSKFHRDTKTKNGAKLNGIFKSFIDKPVMRPQDI